MAHDHHGTSLYSSLTKNEQLVYEVMEAINRPQKAYDLLDILKGHGVRAPMTIYRALEGLEQKGLVHKLDALNAFVLCNHDEPHPIQTFLVCDNCSSVQEIEGSVSTAPSVEGNMSVEGNIMAVAAEEGFHMEEARLEVKGLCVQCT